jgi:hypothetical protein
MIRAGGVLLMLATLVGCAGPGVAERERGAEQGEAIINGEVSGSSDDGVVLLRAVPTDVEELLCSATLVAPNLLITARHCVSYFQEGYFNCSPRGEVIDATDNAGHLGLHFDPKSIEVYGREQRDEPLAHGSQIISTLSATVCVNDLAFVVLDTPLTLPIVPMRLGTPARDGEASVLVGFGVDGSGHNVDFQTATRHRKAGLEIADVGPDSLAEGVIRTPPRTLVLQGPSGCIGDSGGPLLDEASGALLGVYSMLQGESCSTPTGRQFLVHVPPFQLLIKQAFAAAGAEPLREPEPSGAGGSGNEPTGAAGADGADSPGDPTSAQSSGCAVTQPPSEPFAAASWVVLALATAVERIRRSNRRGPSRRRWLRD